jgi:hypothetical protein
METMTSGTSNISVASNDAVIPQTTATPSSTPTPPATTPTPGKARVAISFLEKDKDAELIVDSERILVSMTGNAAYPAPIPDLADLATARTAYIAGVNAAHDSTIARTTRRELRATLVGMLRNLAHYVQMTCAGNATTLLSSGFLAQRSRAKVGPLLPPTGLILKAGKLSGQVKARCHKQAQAGAYHWQIGPTATPMVWQPMVTSLAAHTVFAGLTKYTQYSVQVCAVGTAGPSNWSDVVTVTAM